MSISKNTPQTAEQMGIQFSHYDIDGNLIYADPISVEYFTKILRSNTGTTNLACHFYANLVGKEGESLAVDLHTLPFSFSSVFSYQLFDEKQKLIAEEKNLSQSFQLAPQTYGYYSLHLIEGEQVYPVRVFIQPKTAFQIPAKANYAGQTQPKCWGINIQLYSLRSERNWGIGDFADLDYLVSQSVAYGVDFIGVNPLHAMYPAVPTWASPYSASSRRWLNWFYLAVDKLVEFYQCKEIQTWFHSDRVQQQLAQLRQQPLVDYVEVKKLKTFALKGLFEFFKTSQLAKIRLRRQAFEKFVRSAGEGLLYQGLFDVLDSLEHSSEHSDEQHIGWLGWRQEWQQLDEKGRQKLLKKYHKDSQFYLWVQWLCQEQLADIQNQCQTLGMTLGIYGDLAVSCSRGGADVWADPQRFLTQVSVGAPPDPLGPIGQNWNIPPYNPTALKAEGFQSFIDLLRANMQFFGVLRIDHIMGLYRLWLIPEGKEAKDGLYVHYPFAELMAILAIESVRNQCVIVGEDLGTVPDEVRWKLDELKIFSYFVLYFAKQGEYFPHKEHFPTNAFATIGTHDVPSLKSFWHCVDLQLFEQVGVLSGDFLQQKYQQRVFDKQALLNTLHRDHYLADDYQGDALTMAMHDNLNQVIHRYLAESHSQLIGVQLENLLQQEISFNLPGTSTEYPNWQHKIEKTVEQIFQDKNICALLSIINQARNQ